MTAWLARKQSGEVITVPRTLSDQQSRRAAPALPSEVRGWRCADWGVADGIADGSLVESE